MQIPVCALTELPTESYTHQYTSSGEKEAVPMREVYSYTNQLDIRAMGIAEGIENIADIDCDNDGNIYMLSSDGRLFALDNNCKFKKEYLVTTENGETVDFSGASGILAVSSNEIYIADTVNERLFEVDENGVIVDEIIRPDSDLLPDDFKFAPVKIEKDSKGTLYVLCDGAYYGALLFNKDGEFGGFYGANTVKGSALTILSYIWDAFTKNDTKRAHSVKKLPFQFLDLYIDSKDFVLTCTGSTGTGTATGQIKKLSPSGTNILYKYNLDGTRTDASGYNFGENRTEKRNNKQLVQNFISVQADERGYIYTLDATYGIIYVYDTDCNLITAFGGGKGEGNTGGIFSVPVSMVYNNKRLYIADSMLNTITIFDITQYGDTLMSAQYKTLSADYLGSKKEWNEVLQNDSSNQLAMRGIAKAYYAEGDYEKASDFAKRGYDFVTYSQALERKQSEIINKNFVWIFIAVVILSGIVVIAVVYSNKKKLVIIKNEKVRILFSTVIHPFDSFNLIRFKNKGSLIIASVMTTLFFITSVVAETTSDFRFTTFNPMSSSAVLQCVKTIGLVALFTIANWAVCVLMEGKGRLKDVYMVVSYATLPLVAYNLLFAIISHMITSPSSALLSGLSMVAMILTGIVLTVGLMIIHEYSFPKFLGSILLTVFAMLLIVFIIFMLGMLISQLWSFIVTIFMEAVYR